jgi:predicted phosphodiesterase
MPSLYLSDADGIIYLNPGSAAISRGGFAPTYALITSERIEIRELEGDRVISFLDLA